MGQLPFHPDTPEGWGENEEWVSAVAMWTRGEYARRLANRMNRRAHLTEILDQPVASAIETLRRGLGILELGPVTRRALEDHLRAELYAGSADRFRNVVTVALLSPEMQLA
jgi:hypothetical protein